MFCLCLQKGIKKLISLLIREKKGGGSFGIVYQAKMVDGQSEREICIKHVCLSLYIGQAMLRHEICV